MKHTSYNACYREYSIKYRKVSPAKADKGGKSWEDNYAESTHYSTLHCTVLCII